MAALHKDGFLVDDVPVEPGDEAVLHDGAILRVGEAKLSLRLYGHKTTKVVGDGPYVTSARRSKAQQGKGDGIGAPGKGEMRREKKLREKQAKQKSAQLKESNDGKKKGRR